VLFFGSGLPQVEALSGNTKSYAKRLFHCASVERFQPIDAKKAIKQPVVDEGEKTPMRQSLKLLKNT
jgi:hypothetical protein